MLSIVQPRDCSGPDRMIGSEMQENVWMLLLSCRSTNVGGRVFKAALPGIAANGFGGPLLLWFGCEPLHSWPLIHITKERIQSLSVVSTGV